MTLARSGALFAVEMPPYLFEEKCCERSNQEIFGVLQTV